MQITSDKDFATIFSHPSYVEDGPQEYLALMMPINDEVRYGPPYHIPTLDKKSDFWLERVECADYAIRIRLKPEQNKD